MGEDYLKMSSIKLYRGTIAKFAEVDLKHCRGKKDFGAGFYTTTDINQAIKLARRMKQNEINKGNIDTKAYIYMIKIDKNDMNSMNTHKFNGASISWVDYVIKNRYIEFNRVEDFDIVIGKVADATTKMLINRFVSEYGIRAASERKQQLIIRLEPENFKDQYCFKTDRAIKLCNKCISRKEV